MSIASMTDAEFTEAIGDMVALPLNGGPPLSLTGMTLAVGRFQMRERGEVEVFDRAMDVQISRLRRKLEAGADKPVIQTHRGVGYMLDAHVTRL